MSYENYADPNFRHWTKGNLLPKEETIPIKPIRTWRRGLPESPYPFMTNSQVPWNENFGGYANGKWMSPSDGFNYSGASIPSQVQQPKQQMPWSPTTPMFKGLLNRNPFKQ